MSDVHTQEIRACTAETFPLACSVVTSASRFFLIVLCSLRSMCSNSMLLVPRPRKGENSSEKQFCIAWKLAGWFFFLGEGNGCVCGGGVCDV